MTKNSFSTFLFFLNLLDTSKSKKMNRTEIIDKIIEEQQKVIDNLQQSVDVYKSESDMDEESTHDREDFSHQSEAKDMQLRFEKLLNEAIQNLNFIEVEREEIHEKIEKGCLVETDKNYLFVGVAIPIFKFNNKEVISFSEEAPVFKSIINKSVGEKIIFAENQLEILDVS